MAVGDYMKPGISSKQRVKILTVDPPTRKVEGMLKDGAMIQIAIWEVSSFFVWPQEEEYWTVYRDNGYWMLGSKMDTPVSSDTQVVDLAPGEAKVNAETIVTPSGANLVSTARVQKASASTGSVATSSRVNIHLSWPIPYPNVNYVAVASVLETTDTPSSLRVLKILSQTSTGIVVKVQNDSSTTAFTGMVNAIALA